MKFIDLQGIVFDLLNADGTSFAGNTVYDFGFQKEQIEDLLDIGNDGPGFALGVWPVTHAALTSDDASGLGPVLARIVTRLDVNPKLLKQVNDAYVADNTKPRVDAFLNGLIQEVISLVLADPEEAGGVKFELDRDAFEMVNFDEGLMAFHIRFRHFVVL